MIRVKQTKICGLQERTVATFYCGDGCVSQHMKLSSWLDIVSVSEFSHKLGELTFKDELSEACAALLVVCVLSAVRFSTDR